MIVIGGGASAVEALEFASEEDADKIYILARSDKWIIPRNPLFNVLLALNIFGQETIFSWIPELILRKFFYRDLQDLAPANKGLFTDTPMVNTDVMHKLRTGKAEWVRCDIERFTDKGVLVNRRAKGARPGSPGQQELIEADIVVMATGYKRPDLSNFLPSDCYDDVYKPPNWYLQTFPPKHPSISCINWLVLYPVSNRSNALTPGSSTYMSAIGTVGNWHIGIYTRE